MINLPNVLVLIFLLHFHFNSVLCNDVEIHENKKPLEWLKSAQNVLAGPAGQMVVQVAKDLVNRSIGNSQILSLNISNFIILILLKALIFAAGLLGAGHYSHYERARNVEDLFLSESEPLLFMGFLEAQESGNTGCLQKAACQSPAIAFEYVRAAKALLNGLQNFSEVTEKKNNYEKLINTIERAAYEGYRGIPCDLFNSTCEL